MDGPKGPQALVREGPRHQTIDVKKSPREGPECHHSHSPSSEGDHNSLHDRVQDGVKNIEAISQAWTKTGLILAYFRYGTTLHLGQNIVQPD